MKNYLDGFASGLREQKNLLTGSQAACESEKSSWLARKWLARMKNPLGWLASGLRAI
jgi:hypothetical protein